MLVALFMRFEYCLLIMSAMNFTFSLHEPSEVVVNSNLAFAITFTIVATVLCGVVLLPVVLFKGLRSQPYQLLVSNYVVCILAVVQGSGIYRAVLIQCYKDRGYVEAAEVTECGVLFFFIFPVAASNYCLFLLGLERFIHLQFKNAINRGILVVFIGIPWAFGIYRYSFYLADADERYFKLPYLGLCVDVTNERVARRTVHLICDFIQPLLLAVIAIILAIIKTYQRYREIHIKMANGNDEDRAQLIEEKNSIKKVANHLLMLIVFVCLRTLFTVVVTLLYREVGKKGRSLEEKYDFSTAATFFLLFEPCIVPVVFAVLNSDLRQVVCNFMLGNVPVRHTDRQLQET